MKSLTLAFAGLIPVSLVSCASVEVDEPPLADTSPRTRVELESLVVADDRSGLDVDKVVLTARQLKEPGNRVMSQENADILPSFLLESETSLSARWVGEQHIVNESSDHQRLLRLRRILNFDTIEEARACFPEIAQSEISVSEEGRADVIAGELSFAIMRAGDGSAIRVRLERLFARKPAIAIARLLPTDEPLPVVASLTLRYVDDGEEVSRTILFAETIDITAGDYSSASQVSDWLAVAPESHPHSIVLGIVGREELNSFTKTLRDAGLGIFDLANKVTGIGLL